VRKESEKASIGKRFCIDKEKIGKELFVENDYSNLDDR
jgi:hypothetical protein